MLNELKKEVLHANLELVKKGLVIYTWGNVSAIDRDKGIIAIKPSGVEYSDMKEEDIVLLDLSGKIIEGKYKPSSDTPTHIELYKAFDKVNSIVHTHSKWATIFAQSGISIPVFGTTHADYFYKAIPCTRDMKENEVIQEYEKETGKVIIETFLNNNLNPNDTPSVLVKNHGPFSWGTSPINAVHNAVVLEEVSNMAYHTIILNRNASSINDYLLDKHYLRKHGKNAYYGQNNK